MSGDRIDSTDDARVGNSPMRYQYRVLSGGEKAQMAALKTKGEELLALIEEFGSSRELSIARTKTEEAVMWAVKHVTR
jgi:N-methylhydantoinase B/oxoprolinase/acetone carboxylase alpha subunit